MHTTRTLEPIRSRLLQLLSPSQAFKHLLKVVNTVMSHSCSIASLHVDEGRGGIVSGYIFIHVLLGSAPSGAGRVDSFCLATVSAERGHSIYVS